MTTTQKLRPWQPAIVSASLAGLATGNFLNGSQMGTGKTYTSIAACVELGLKAVIIARIGARSTWEDAAEHFSFTDYRITNVEAVRAGNTEYGTWKVDGFRPDTGKPEKTFVWNIPAGTVLIIDEIHGLAGATSLNGKLLRAAVSQGVKILGLSGTACDDPRKMRGIGFMLGLHKDADFNTWLFRQGATPDSWDFGLHPKLLATKKGQRDLEGKRIAQMASIHARLTQAGRFARVRTSEIPGFPKCLIEPVQIDFSDKRIAVILEEMNRELLDLKRKSGNPTAGQREVMVRALQKAELLMVPEILAEIEEGLAEGMKCGVFVNYKATVQALAERLKTTCLFTGDEPAEVREGNRLDYQEDRERVILLNSGAGSESISLHDITGRYPNLGIVIPGFQAVQFNQILGRFPRAGALTPSTYRILFGKNGVQNAAYKRSKERMALYGSFNGDVTFTDSDLCAGLNL